MNSYIPVGALFVIGLSLFLYGLISLLRSNMSSRWIRVNVSFIDKAISKREELIGFYGGRLVYYCVAVKYTYEYAGTEYIGGSIYIDRKSACFLKICDAENMLRILDDIAFALIQPGKVSRSVLVSGLSDYRRSHFIATLMSGCVLVVIAVCFCFMSA